MEKTLKIGESTQDIVALLRENYWHMSVNGAQAMRDMWTELADNEAGFKETAQQLGVGIGVFHEAANLLGEWLRVNGMMDRSPLDASLEIRKEKLKFPEATK